MANKAIVLLLLAAFQVLAVNTQVNGQWPQTNPASQQQQSQHPYSFPNNEMSTQVRYTNPASQQQESRLPYSFQNNETPTQVNGQHYRYQNQASQQQGKRQQPNYQQDVQVATRFGGGQDPHIEAIDMRQPPPPAAAPVADSHPSATTNYMDRFSSKLFQKIALPNAQRNLVYSPVAVHALMGLIYGVSEGKTLVELRKAGVFSDNQTVAVQDFADLIYYRKGLGNLELTMATNVYYNERLGGVNPSFRPYAEHYFGASIESLDMLQPKYSSDKVNAWASDKTRGKIQNLISASDLTPQTSALLVNAIYFKGQWENDFATMDTLPTQFQHSDGRNSSVAMMYNDDIYGLVDIPELDATVLELAYKTSGTSMLILLPKQPNGLKKLERQLKRPEFDLNVIASRVRRQQVVVRLPRFRIEFEQDMTSPLQELGVRQMFTPQAQIVNMLNDRVRVEKVLQKAFIEVNEAGTEAGAASYAKFVPLSLPPKAAVFTADHPFVFAIRTASSVLFSGHVEFPEPMAPGSNMPTVSPNYNRGQGQ